MCNVLEVDGAELSGYFEVDWLGGDMTVEYHVGRLRLSWTLDKKIKICCTKSRRETGR